MAEENKINVMSGMLDKIGLTTSDLSELDDRYVNITGDTMTGQLTITPSTGTTALKADQDIILESGKKLIFDG